MVMIKEEEKTFEASMQRLQQIVERLEGGELSLEESLKLYEEGVGLVQLCSKRLEHAQGRIETLMRGPSGDLKIQEVDPTDLAPKGRKKK